MITLRAKDTGRLILSLEGKCPRSRALLDIWKNVAKGDTVNLLPDFAPGVEISITNPHLLFCSEEHA